MRQPPFQFALEVRANLYKEGSWWVAECPAFSVATQGRTKGEARAMLREAMELSFEVHRERGTFGEALKVAAKHPLSRALREHGESLTVTVPPELVAAAANVQKARAAA